RTPHAYTLGAEASEAAGGERSQIAGTIGRRLRVALPTINVLEAIVTYVFVTYVVPLPGGAPPAAARGEGLIATIALVGVSWLVCDLWGSRAVKPVQDWLDQDREPTASERLRTLRLPALEAGQVLVVWVAAAIGSFVFD